MYTSNCKPDRAKNSIPAMLATLLLTVLASSCGKSSGGSAEAAPETATIPSEELATVALNGGAPKQISIYDTIILQLATHDMFHIIRKEHCNDDLDISCAQEHEDGKLNLSSPFDGTDDRNLRIGCQEPFPSAPKSLDSFTRTLRGMYFVRKSQVGKSRAFSEVLAMYHKEIMGAYERTFDEPFPRPRRHRNGTLTADENLAFRTTHDFLNPTIFETDLDNSKVVLGGVLDGSYELPFGDGPGPGFTGFLKPLDESFAIQFNTEHSLAELLAELEDGHYDPNDKAMVLIRKMFSKAIVFNPKQVPTFINVADDTGGCD